MRSIQRLKLGFSACALLFLSDCSKSSKPDAVVSLYTEAPMGGAEGDFFSAGFWPTESWWEVFEDPCLNVCIETALKNNPDLLVAKSRVEEAFQVALREGGPRWFQAGVDGSVTMMHISSNGLYKALNPSLSSNGTLIDLGGVLSYEVDIWGKNYQRYMAAVNLFQASGAKDFLVQVDVSTRVAESYYILQSLEAQLETVNEWLGSQQEILDLSTLLLKYRMLDRIQLETVQQELEALKQDFERLKMAKELQRHMLAVLMGCGPDAKICVGTHFLEPTQNLVIPQNLNIGLLKRRPDLAADIYFLESLKREVKMAKTLFYPDINILGSGGWDAFTGTNFFSPSSLTGMLLPSFTLPVFTGFRLSGNLGAKIKAYEAGVHQYNAHVLKAAQEVKDAVSRIEDVVMNIGYQKNILDEESIKLELTQILTKNRIYNKIQLDREKNALYEKWITMYNLYRERYQRHIQLIRALGGGFSMEKNP